MAMNKNVLGAALWTRVKAETSFSPTLSAEHDAKNLALWTAIADEIITHFLNEAEIRINTFTAVAPGVQTGVGQSANITGTAAGEIIA